MPGLIGTDAFQQIFASQRTDGTFRGSQRTIKHFRYLGSCYDIVFHNQTQHNFFILTYPVTLLIYPDTSIIYPVITTVYPVIYLVTFAVYPDTSNVYPVIPVVYPATFLIYPVIYPDTLFCSVNYTGKRLS
jgi:hypothetical protein